MKYRKKPIEIEAIQWTGYNAREIADFVGMHVRFDICHDIWEAAPAFDLTILTPEGDMRADIYDFIIKGVNGEFYPCKPDIFAKTYEVVE